MWSTWAVARRAGLADPGVDGSGTDSSGVRQVDGVGTIRARARAVRAEYATALSALAGNRRIEVAPLYGPLIAHALRAWGTHTLYLALDTSLLWNQYCLIRLSVVYRGRAVPVVWEVIDHGKSSVTHAAYEALLDAVPPLLPAEVKVVFLAGSRLCRYGVVGAPASVRVALPHSD